MFDIQFLILYMDIQYYESIFYNQWSISVIDVKYYKLMFDILYQFLKNSMLITQL